MHKLAIRRPWRELASAVIENAIADYRAGRECKGENPAKGHNCKADAERFLRSEWATTLLYFLDLDPARVRRELGIVEIEA
jgi:hypothetical protein